MLNRLYTLITRRKSPVKFSDLSTNKPISTVFGLDRGTAIDRYYIKIFYNDNKDLIRGNVLEVGDDEYSSIYNNKVVHNDILHAVDDRRSDIIVGDLTNTATLPKEKYDCFIATQTLNFIFDVNKAVGGCNYLLKPGGTFMGTVSGISQISRFDMDRWGDYWRFTDLSIKRALENHFQGNIQIQTFGNVLSSIAYLQGIAVEDLPDSSLLDEPENDYQMTICFIATK